MEILRDSIAFVARSLKSRLIHFVLCDSVCGQQKFQWLFSAFVPIELIFVGAAKKTWKKEKMSCNELSAFVWFTIARATSSTYSRRLASANSNSLVSSLFCWSEKLKRNCQINLKHITCSLVAHQSDTCNEWRNAKNVNRKECFTFNFRRWKKNTVKTGDKLVSIFRDLFEVIHSSQKKTNFRQFFFHYSLKSDKRDLTRNNFVINDRIIWPIAIISHVTHRQSDDWWADQNLASNCVSSMN